MKFAKVTKNSKTVLLSAETKTIKKENKTAETVCGLWIVNADLLFLKIKYPVKRLF